MGLLRELWELVGQAAGRRWRCWAGEGQQEGQAAPMRFLRGFPTHRRGTFAPLLPARAWGRHCRRARHVRASYFERRRRFGAPARRTYRSGAIKLPLKAAALARQRGAPAPQRSWGRAFRATRGARSEVMIGGGVRATRGARSEVGPSSSRRDPGPGCVCAPLAACRTLPLPARLRLKRPSDARSAERGEGVRATRGARSEVGSCLAPRSRPWLRLCAAGCLPNPVPHSPQPLPPPSLPNTQPLQPP